MIRLELSPEMIAVIGAALGNHPFRQAAPVVAELQRQIDAQNAKGSNGAIKPIVVETEETKPNATN